MIDLKPCPFCGHKANQGGGNPAMTWCRNQGCELRGLGFSIEAWNKRPSQTVAPAEPGREWRFVARVVNGEASSNEQEVDEAIALLHKNNPTSGFRKQWRVKAGPWQDVK